MSDPLDYGGNPAQATALARLEKLGASIGEIDDTSIHVELKPCFGGTAIGDAAIPQVVQDVNTLGNVATLDLGETAITDAATVHLGTLRGVKNLYLTNDKITDDGVQHLSALGELESLVLSGTSVTDAAVPHLARMKGLRFLQAFGTSMTPAGVAALKKALPRLKVEGFK